MTLLWRLRFHSRLIFVPRQNIVRKILQQHFACTPADVINATFRLWARYVLNKNHLQNGTNLWTARNNLAVERTRAFPISPRRFLNRSKMFILLLDFGLLIQRRQSTGMDPIRYRLNYNRYVQRLRRIVRFPIVVRCWYARSFEKANERPIKIPQRRYSTHQITAKDANDGGRQSKVLARGRSISKSTQTNFKWYGIKLIVFHSNAVKNWIRF